MIPLTQPVKDVLDALPPPSARVCSDLSRPSCSRMHVIKTSLKQTCKAAGSALWQEDAERHRVP